MLTGKEEEDDDQEREDKFITSSKIGHEEVACIQGVGRSRGRGGSIES